MFFGACPWAIEVYWYINDTIADCAFSVMNTRDSTLFECIAIRALCRGLVSANCRAIETGI